MEIILLGSSQIIGIVLGMTLIWRIPFSVKYVSEIIFILNAPAIMVLYVLEQTNAIIVLLLITSIYFPIKTKSMKSLIDVYLLFIGGIIMDHLAQIIGSFVGDATQNISFITLFLVYIWLYYLFRRYWLQQMQSAIFIMLLPMTLLTVISYYIYSSLFFEVANALYITLTIQIVYFICLAFIFYIAMKNIKKEHLIAQKTIEFEQFSLYTAELEKINSDMHKFRHDYNNILLTIQSYLQDNKIDELKAYFQQEILKTDKYTLTKSAIYNNLEQVQNQNVKGLLAAKILQAQEKDIELKIEIPEPIEQLPMNIIDLVRVLGIFLDNAIEQCEIELHKEINFAILDTDRSIVLIIQNPISECSLSISAMYQKGISSKGEQRGLGLSTAKAIISEQPNCILNTRIEHGLFIQEIEILK